MPQPKHVPYMRCSTVHEAWLRDHHWSPLWQHSGSECCSRCNAFPTRHPPTHPPCPTSPPTSQEITRRVNLHNVWQAAYTAGVLIPKPVATCRYYHRSLNPKKLIEVNFSRLAVSEPGTRLQLQPPGVAGAGMDAALQHCC
jgi:hypothetical protein